MILARFGHQNKITGIDVLSQERVVTSGARDGSVRIWKIVEESQLVFHGHRCAILAAAIYMSYVDGMCSGQQASFADFVCILI